jgi:hypothetical protein
MLYLQGIALNFNEVIPLGNGEFVYLKTGSVTVADDVGLQFDHRGKKFGNGNIDVYVSESGIAFRYLLPESWESTTEIKIIVDEIESYLAVSPGFTITKSEIMTIDGVKFKVISAAVLNEISIISTEPAVKSSYARLVSHETIGELANDCESGRLDIVGKVIGLHRKISADGGPVKYNHTLSAHERASNRFMSALMRLDN